MNLFDIIGPVMVGPSSSHTAGAAKIGKVCRQLLGEDVAAAQILLHGSFLLTGKGHGTDRALVAGLLGFEVDDPRIPDSFACAERAGMEFAFGSCDLGPDAHPNSAKLYLTGKSGQRLEAVAASVGGGRIRVKEVNGLAVDFGADCPTLIVQNHDEPGLVAEVASLLEMARVNIAAMQLSRSGRSQNAVMVIECDQEISPSALDLLSQGKGVEKVTYYSPGVK